MPVLAAAAADEAEAAALDAAAAAELAPAEAAEAAVTTCHGSTCIFTPSRLGTFPTSRNYVLYMFDSCAPRK